MGDGGFQEIFREEIMTQEEYWFWLCSCEGIYPESIGALLAAYGSPQNIYMLDWGQLAHDKVLPQKLLWNLVNEKKTGNFLRRHEKLKELDMEFVYFESEKFPQRLRCIPNHPYCLYVRGRLPNPNLAACAMVGARACSGYGSKAAVDFAAALAQEGIQVISGMASGIDSIAQKAALDAGGATFAVLGSGADVIYPAENTKLYYRIINEGGGIISEYPPKTAPAPWQFPHRNRIISGLADKLLIFEARKRSGTLSTARHALDQGKDIYALPGRINDPLSEGCNELIFDGAGILLSPGRIINDFFSASETGENAFWDAPASEKKENEEGLIRFLSYHAKNADEIAAQAKISIEEAMVQLAMLEIEGRVKEVGKNYYVKA